LRRPNSEDGRIDVGRLCAEDICKLKEAKKGAKAVKDSGEDYQ
jgi:hypothetical protein